MSLKSRLLVYINSLLLITIIFGLLAIMVISQKNIRDEILSTQSLAVFAIENGIQKNPEFSFSKTSAIQTFQCCSIAVVFLLRIPFRKLFVWWI